jgi:hypothetical protein
MAAMDAQALAERVRAACIEAALQAYEDAGLQGLCAEGRWEVAVGAMRTLDLHAVVHDAGSAHPSPSAS